MQCGFSRGHEKSSRLRYQVECSGVLLIVLDASPCHMEDYVFTTFSRRAVFLCPLTHMCLMYASKDFNWDGVYFHPALSMSSLYSAREQYKRGKQRSDHTGDALFKQGWRLVLLNYCK